MATIDEPENIESRMPLWQKELIERRKQHVSKSINPMDVQQDLLIEGKNVIKNIFILTNICKKQTVNHFPTVWSMVSEVSISIFVPIHSFIWTKNNFFLSVYCSVLHLRNDM